MTAELACLRWRCRRGMRELDELLLPYLENTWPQADPVQQAAFARLLELPDPLLWDWVIAGLPCPDPELAELCEAIRTLA